MEVRVIDVLLGSLHSGGTASVFVVQVAEPCAQAVPEVLAALTCPSFVVLVWEWQGLLCWVF